MNPTPTLERIRVRYGETDQMGHAYYANYLLWFEQARGAWCRDHGFTYKWLEELGYKLPVVEVYARYKDEIKYDDVAVIHVWLEETKRAAMKFAYRVFNESTGKLSTEGYTWHVFIGPDKRATTIPPEIREMLNREPLSAPDSNGTA